MSLQFDNINYSDNLKLELISKGKVRDIYNLSNNNEYLLFNTSDRCSAFDYHICDINMKGNYLTKIAAFWFKKLGNICYNHYLHYYQNLLLVKKCKPIKLEFIVRGYITGSCWRAYSEGQRVFCGVNLPDNLEKNQKFAKPIITPTTKDEHDAPISKELIICNNLLSPSQLDYIYEKITRLFNEGSRICAEKGILLVDTKYEFGYDNDGYICLIDEIHTPDSSRFWMKDSYDKYLENKSENKIVNLDKDGVRNYLIDQNFLNDIKNSTNNNVELQIPTIPNNIKLKVQSAYSKFYSLLTDETSTILNYINDTTYNSELSLENIELFSPLYHNLINEEQKLVVVVAGSCSDKEHTDKILSALKEKNIMGGCCFMSAHKQTRKVMNGIDYVNSNFKNVIWITVAGMSNALSGVVASNTQFPVFACPPFKDYNDFMININSTLQMPSKVPVMTVINVKNAVLCCERIFDLSTF